MPGPLAGVRVLDVTTVVLGPWAAQMLGDMPDIPTTYSRTPGAIRRLLPRLGEHSVEVLHEAGFSQAEIDAMLASGVTRAGPR